MKHTFELYTTSFHAGNRKDRMRGFELIRQGKCALLILAGGQGSRFHCRGPKGCVPITPFKQKTLFRLLAERVKAASIQARTPLQIALMTSPLNHEETEHYFVKNAFFGLNPTQVIFFSQEIRPLTDLEGNPFFESPGKIAMAPNGNGGVFKKAAESGVLRKWEQEGISYIQVLPIDNPLALPFDAELIGFQEKLGCEVAIKAAPRIDPSEKVGLLVRIQEKLHIIEYTEVQDSRKAIANLGIFGFTLPFMERASQFQLPRHQAKKAVMKDGILPDHPNAFKEEEFIFDVLPFANSCEALLYPREEVFAPLKNLKGVDSMESVHAALQENDWRTFARITGKKPPKGVKFELSPSFYYPTEALLERWRGREFPNQEYIEETG